MTPLIISYSYFWIIKKKNLNMINSEESRECFYKGAGMFKKRVTKNKRKFQRHAGNQEVNRKWAHHDKIKKKQRTLKRKARREEKLKRGQYQPEDLSYSYGYDTNEDYFSESQENQYFMDEP